MNARPLLSSLTCLAMVAGACNLQAAGIRADKQLNYPDYSRKPGDLVISRSAYAEKFEGFWLGECIANWTGLRTEGVKKTAPFFTDKDWGTNQGRNRQKMEFVLVEEEMYDFIRKDYEDNPDKDNWEKTRDALNRRHTGVTTDGYNYRSWFDAGINYGASLVSLFYGQGDFKRTIRIGALCGWDSDNPTATWGGLLGFLLGREGVEKAFPDKKLSGLYNISRTRINFPDRTPDQPGDDSFALMAERGIHIIDRVVIEEMGGGIDLEKDTWLIPGSGFMIKAAQSESANSNEEFVWKSEVPDDCPFEQSKDLGAIKFTGRHSDYRCGDTFYPSWASDGNLYSPWTDGTTDGISASSGRGEGVKAETGHAVMIGDDPVNLVIKNTSPLKIASAKPYQGRYPAGSLVYNGIWYYGTYCLGPDGSYNHRGYVWNWPNLGPIPGFQISRDLGKTWTPSPLSPEKPLFPEPKKHLGTVKMGAPHFVDFGKNMQYSPDGKAYMLGMGAEENDPKPRPCIHVGEAGKQYEVRPCDEDFDHANLSWISADQIYLARVTPSPETINDIKAWEFFAGHDKDSKPIWTSDFEKIKPLLEWNNNMGCVTATYVPALKKYLMCVTDGWPTVANMDSYILEADTLTGPWRMVTYMKDFGEQAYFLNFPSKFISSDGMTLWLCYSANFSDWANGIRLKFNPPGGRYGLCLHEIKLLEPGGK